MILGALPKLGEQYLVLMIRESYYLGVYFRKPPLGSGEGGGGGELVANPELLGL